MATIQSRHPVTVTTEFDSFPSISIAVDCLDADLGAERPCAVWADCDGTERLNECAFQQYADALAPDEWITGGRISVIGYLFQTGSGDDFSAEVSTSCLRVGSGSNRHQGWCAISEVGACSCGTGNGSYEGEQP